jgi:catechol 2,3-dioxygenase-like lactoylglutathione lyase family enzyme
MELDMLNRTDAIATVAVKDLPAAAKFYEGTLGFTKLYAEGDEVITYRSGNSLLNVYHSDFAGTNKATAVTWSVGDHLEAIVKTLKDKGVVFEHFSLPGLTRKGDVHMGGDMKVAWFKDPDGNILSMVSQ